MALNICEMWFNGIKIAFFSKKLQKIAQQLGASASGRWGPTPRPPDSDTFELHRIFQNVSKVTCFTF